MKPLVLLVVLLLPPPDSLPMRPNIVTRTTNHDGHADTPEQAFNPRMALKEIKEPNGRQQQSPSEEKQPIAPEKGPDYVFWGLWVNLALAVATSVLALFAALQASAAKGMVKALINSERAWVLVGAVGNPREGWYRPDMQQYFPGGVFRFRVYGNTPARIVNARMRLHPVPVVPGSDPPKPDLPATPNYGSGSGPTALEIPGEGITLPPRGTFTIRVGLEGGQLTEDQWTKLQRREMLMCAYGFVKYRDSFDKERETRISYTYDFALGGVFTDTDGKPINPPGFYPGGPDAYIRAT